MTVEIWAMGVMLCGAAAVALFAWQAPLAAWVALGFLTGAWLVTLRYVRR